MDDVKPYAGGNDALLFLHELNIWDKHQFLIPMEKPLVKIDGVRFEDDEQMLLDDDRFFLLDDSSRIRLKWKAGQKVTIKDKGQASATIFFDYVSTEEPAVPTLRRVAQEVSRTIQAFELL